MRYARACIPITNSTFSLAGFAIVAHSLTIACTRLCIKFKATLIQRDFTNGTYHTFPVVGFQFDAI